MYLTGLRPYCEGECTRRGISEHYPKKDVDRLQARKKLAMLLIFTLCLFFLPTAGMAAAGGKPGAAQGAVVRVVNPAELSAAIQNATAGVTIVLGDGVYADTAFVVSDKHGTADAPITIRAEHQGNAVITGSGSMTIVSSSYLVLDGLVFTNTGSSAVVLDSSNHVRVTRSKFALTEDGTTVKWLVLQGTNSHDNRIDHNEFGPRHDPGQTIAMDGDGSTEPSRHDVIEYNYFHDMGPKIANGMETIRVGLSGISQLDGFTTIQYNLFENCDGDPEFISVKTSHNTVRYNTFRNNDGQVTARHGNANAFYGNVFIGDGVKPGVGGFRIYGNDQKIYNNYFEKMTYFVLDINSGDFDGGPDAANYTRSDLSKHWRVYRAEVVHNTIVDSTTGIIVGRKYHADKPPVDSVVANNIVRNTTGKLIDERLSSNTVFAGNIGFGSSLGNVPRTPAEIREVDPLFVTVNGLQKLSASSPAIDAAVGSSAYAADDMDGQARPVGAASDVGADEYSAAPVLNHPLTAADVGPNAFLTIGGLAELIDGYAASGDLRGPLAAQVSNSVDQAAHQYGKGAYAQAIEHLGDLSKHLHNPALSEHVAPFAAAALDRYVAELSEWWAEEAKR